MTDLHSRLQSALGTAFALRSELGGGGMSRVFLAHDPTLGRDVVIKMLHPELVSGVNTDRFKREIQLVARLQHPHIVPILSTGEVDGIPFFTMPFVAGRSLRERLAESGPLPIGEAVDILRDVARALAFAHGRGVIHRDIKPDNVLLAQGSATVTDFGVAKAVSAALRESGGTLTSVGTSIGTPVYMAPEQAAGDPGTDHRADLYAWGVMAYELLCGRPPFTHTSPHKLLAAHMSEPPEPLTNHRPDCPIALSALVMDCLVKDPSHRVQSADDVLRRLSDIATTSGTGDSLTAISIATRRALVRALGIYAVAFVLVAALAQAAVVTIGLPGWVLPGTLMVMALGLPVVLFTALVHHGSRVARTLAIPRSGGTVHGSSTMARIAVKASPYVTWRRAALGGAVAVAAFAVLVVGFMMLRALGIGPAGSLFAKGLINESDQILVADFDSPSNDSTLGGVVSEGIRTGLGQSRSLRIVQSSEIAGALQRMQQPASTRLTADLAREVAEREGFKAIVNGRVTPVGSSGSYILAASLVTPTGDLLATVQESAKDATDLIPAIDRATRALRGKVGESLKTVRETMHLERATTASLPALRKYTEAVKYNGIRRYDRAIDAGEEAIRLDTTFAMAYRLTSLAYGNAGIRLEHADSLRARSFQLRDRLPELERALVEATYYGNSQHTDRAQALAANLRALDVDPTSVSAWNGAAQIYVARREYAKAESAYKKIKEYRPDIAIPWNSHAESQFNQGKIGEGEATLAEYQRRFPQLPTIAAVWPQIMRGQLDSVKATCAAVVANAALPSQTRANTTLCLAAVEMEQGHLGVALAHLQASRATNAARGANVSDQALQIDSSLVDAWFLDNPERAVRRLDAMLASKPLRSLPLRGAAPHFDLIQIYALAGVADRARALLAEYDDLTKADTARRRIYVADWHRARGRVAVAEKHYEDALREFAASDTSYDGFPVPCGSCTIIELARTHDLAGHADLAIAGFERYLAYHIVERYRDNDRLYLAGVYKRLGELYEAKGDRERAISNYSNFLRLWKTADSELQPNVESVRRRLQALSVADRR